MNKSSFLLQSLNFLVSGVSSTSFSKVSFSYVPAFSHIMYGTSPKYFHSITLECIMYLIWDWSQAHVLKSNTLIADYYWIDSPRIAEAASRPRLTQFVKSREINPHFSSIYILKHFYSLRSYQICAEKPKFIVSLTCCVVRNSQHVINAYAIPTYIVKVLQMPQLLCRYLRLTIDQTHFARANSRSTIMDLQDLNLASFWRKSAAAWRSGWTLNDISWKINHKLKNLHTRHTSLNILGSYRVERK